VVRIQELLDNGEDVFGVDGNASFFGGNHNNSKKLTFLDDGNRIAKGVPAGAGDKLAGLWKWGWGGIFEGKSKN